jgi:hypothetical protein
MRTRFGLTPLTSFIVVASWIWNLSHQPPTRPYTPTVYYSGHHHRR